MLWSGFLRGCLCVELFWFCPVLSFGFVCLSGVFFFDTTNIRGVRGSLTIIVFQFLLVCFFLVVDEMEYGMMG